MQSVKSDLQDALNALDACMVELDHAMQAANTVETQLLLSKIKRLAVRIDMLRRQSQ